VTGTCCVDTRDGRERLGDVGGLFGPDEDAEDPDMVKEECTDAVDAGEVPCSHSPCLRTPDLPIDERAKLWLLMLEVQEGKQSSCR
jgi:hypothetical protein